MLRIIFAAFVLSAIFSGCDPVKRILRDPIKTREVASEYLKQFPFKDSIVYKPGRDTTILRDTTIIDTTWLEKPIPYRVTERKYLDRLVVDTNAIYDRANLRALQSLLCFKDSIISILMHDKSDLRKQVRNRGWIIAGLIAGLTAIATIFVVKKAKQWF